MRVTSLTLTDLRAIEAARFRFAPGFNLIVGVNGVGKTTVLEAISRGLAHVIRKGLGTAISIPPLSERDVRQGAIAATVALDLEVAGQQVRVQEQAFSSGSFPTRPGELASEVDVHALGLQRRGRLRQAHREAQEVTSRTRGPTFAPDEKLVPVLAGREDSALLAVYFSTSRAHPSRSGTRARRAVSPQNAAYVDAFTGRELAVSEFADWLDVLHKTAGEREDARPILRAIDDAVQRFLPGYLRVYPSSDDQKELLMEQHPQETLTASKLSLVERQQLLAVLRDVALHMSTNWPPEQLRGLSSRKLSALATVEREGRMQEQVARSMPAFENLRVTGAILPDHITEKDLRGQLGGAIQIDRRARSISASQLSDGERSMLALVLDLSRRLAQANLGLPDPAANATAVVLIDELELHLHPKWQRSIIGNLTKAFPNCQFIATTHSPQVIGEVASGHVVVMHRFGQVELSMQTFGRDSNWILRHVLEADDRNPEVARAIETTLQALQNGRIRAARAGVRRLRGLVGETSDVADIEARVARAEILVGAPEQEPSPKPRLGKRKK
jgi:predicted ATP-binding protein involved in virulence